MSDFVIQSFLLVETKGEYQMLFNINFGHCVAFLISMCNDRQTLCAEPLAGPFMHILLFFQKIKKTGTNL